MPKIQGYRPWVALIPFSWFPYVCVCGQKSHIPELFQATLINHRSDTRKVPKGRKSQAYYGDVGNRSQNIEGRATRELSACPGEASKGLERDPGALLWAMLVLTGFQLDGHTHTRLPCDTSGTATGWLACHLQVEEVGFESCSGDTVLAALTSFP